MGEVIYIINEVIEHLKNAKPYHMSYKLQTQLHHFKIGHKPADKSLIVEWYYFDLDEEGENERGFTYDELTTFQNYVVENVVNFDGLKNYHATDEFDVPTLEVYDLVPDERLTFPKYLILKPQPKLQHKGISTAMEIILLDKNNQVNHDYNLPFGAIGKIKTY